MTVSAPMLKSCRTGHTPIDALPLDGRMFIGEPREVSRSLSVVLLLSNDANTAAKRPKNHFCPPSAADLLNDILTQPLGAARAVGAPGPTLCIIGRPRSVWADIPRRRRRWLVIGCAANVKPGCNGAA